MRDTSNNIHIIYRFYIFVNGFRGYFAQKSEKFKERPRRGTPTGKKRRVSGHTAPAAINFDKIPPEMD